MPCLGLAVYCWDRSHQNELVREWLYPAILGLDRAGWLEAFWFDRFDVRGPHLALVFATSGPTDRLAEQLQGSLTAFLAARPSPTVFDEDEIRAFHVACRGRQQCAADRLPGFAENNTFEIYEHPDDDFPFGLGRGYVADRALWAAVDTVSRASVAALCRAQPTPTRDAIRLVAEIDGALHTAGRDHRGFWRHHAGSLLRPLERRLAADPGGVAAALPEWIGASNRAAFEPVFDAEPAPPSGLLRLAELAPGEDRGGNWHLLRELVHSFTKQLGLPVALEIPLILFAFWRSLGDRPAIPVEASLVEARC